MRRLLTIGSCVLMCGCASLDKGRVALIDLDLRRPEQVTAQVPENAVVYAQDTTNAPAQKLGFSPVEVASPWFLAFDFLKVMQGRVRILSIEWRTK